MKLSVCIPMYNESAVITDTAKRLTDCLDAHFGDDYEVIFADDVEKIFGKRPWQSRSEELLEAQMRADAERMAEERAKELEAQKEVKSEE